MEVTLFKQYTTWRSARTKRVRSFIHISAIIYLVIAGLWLLLNLYFANYKMAGLLFFALVLSLLCLSLIRKNQINKAGYLIILSGGIYFTTICVTTSGPQITNDTTHIWFIVMAIYSYFILTEIKSLFRELIPAAFFLLSFLFHFKFIQGTGWIQLDAETARYFSLIDIIMAFMVIFILIRLFVLEITRAESMLIRYSDRLDSLIENILPKPIAERLKKEGKKFVDTYQNCTVLFADISGFTQWAADKSAAEVVDRLDNVFTKFDSVAEKLGLTKIKTIGDAYMVVAGIPEPLEDAELKIAEFARYVHKTADDFKELHFRCGINNGPVVAGIIGKNSLVYDLWGDTVNVASRIESNGIPGKTLVSEKVYEALKTSYPNATLIEIEAKGHGLIKAYIL